MTLSAQSSLFAAYTGLCTTQPEYLDSHDRTKMIESGMKPYLPWRVRSKLGQLSRSDILRFFSPGEFLHVDMNEEESSWITKFVQMSRKRQERVDYSRIAEALPRRTLEAVEAFVSDFDAGKVNTKPSCIIAGPDQLSMARFPRKIQSKKSHNRSDFLLNRSLGMASQGQALRQIGGYAEVASWSGCSGTVIMMATPTSSVLPNGLFTCLAGSATETDPSRQRTGLQDPYNRRGELVALQLDGSSMSCRVLDGHRVVHNDGRVMRSTVSCVVHSDTNSAFVTGGYDGTVAIWSDDRMTHLSRLGPHRGSINSIAADSRSYGILYGTSKGELIWCADPLASGVPSLHFLSQERVVAGQPSPLANSADMVALSARGKSIAFVGYGYFTTLRTGSVNTYDLGTLQPSDTIKLPYDKSLTDMSLHPQEHLLAIASGILFDDKSNTGDGEIRLHDLRTASSQMSISSRQMDIHRLAFSPCGEMIYSNDSTTGQMLVHDLRYFSRPLWSHSHSEALGRVDDHFLGFSWFPHELAGIPSGLLMTGGNDAHLRFWDMRRAEPLLEQHDLRQPINNVVVSADGANVWAGTEFGSVHLLSRNPGLAELGGNIEVSFERASVS